ncbi:MAG: DUF4249 family protein [Bacteroidales bacterium]|nr:DUF4249 family protein [Bacteroidales bacterium]
MKTNIYILVLAFLAIISTGCENDIDLKANSTSGILCINGSLTAGANNNVVNVALTGKKDVTYVSDAKVVVSVNGIEVETINGLNTIFDPDNDNLYTLRYYTDGDYLITAKFNPGDHVQIDVYYNNQHAYGGGIVPQPIKEASMQVGFKENVPYKYDMWSVNYHYSDMSTMAISITDPDASQKNYFRLETSQSDSVKMRIDEENHFLDSYNGWRLREAYDDRYIKDGHVVYGYCDTYNNWKFYFDNDPILSAEEVQNQESDISFMSAVSNVYKIFTDNYFNGSTATINAMLRVMSDNDFNNNKPEKYYYNDQKWGHQALHDIDYYAPRYTHRNYAKVYSITEDEYYYLKVLNARGPESYFDFNEDMSLTGDVKLPSNVSGGTGNIFLSSRIEISGSLYEDYVPEYGGEEFPYYYVDEEE